MIEEQTVHLSAKVKTQIIKQIFKDLSPKHLKSVQFFLVICSADRMELQFMSTPKDILITIILKKDLFAHYAYNKQKPSLHKYSLDDFSVIGIMFENNKQILDLDIDETRFLLTYTGGLGQTQFYGQGLSCDQDDQEFVIDQKDLRPSDSNSMQLRFGKVGVFESVIRYFKSCKLNSLWFRYDSVSQRLQITDRKENQEIRWLLKVQQVCRNNLNSQLQFHFKSFSVAMNLLPNDSPLKLTFYPNFMLIQVLERERTFFAIRLNAKIQIET